MPELNLPGMSFQDSKLHIERWETQGWGGSWSWPSHSHPQHPWPSSAQGGITEAKSATLLFACGFEPCFGEKFLASREFQPCLQSGAGWCVISWESFTASTHQMRADLSRKCLCHKGETPLLFFVSLAVCLYSRAGCGRWSFTKLSRMCLRATRS